MSRYSSKNRLTCLFMADWLIVVCDEHLIPAVEVFIRQFKVPEEVAAVKQTIAERDAEREAYKVAAAAKDEQRAAAIEAVQVAGEEGRSSLQRGIEEERGARDRLGAELRQSVQAVRDVSERFDAKLGKLQDRVDERLHGATDTCRKLVEKVRLDANSRDGAGLPLAYENY